MGMGVCVNLFPCLAVSTAVQWCPIQCGMCRELGFKCPAGLGQTDKTVFFSEVACWLGGRNVLNVLFFNAQFLRSDRQDLFFLRSNLGWNVFEGFVFNVQFLRSDRQGCFFWSGVPNLGWNVLNVLFSMPSFLGQTDKAVFFFFSSEVACLTWGGMC